MEYKTLELNIASAKDLKNVNLFTKMGVYAVVSLSGDPHHHQKIKTPVDRDGGKNPTWNFPIKLTLNESLARQNRLTLEIKLRCQRNLAADKDVGQIIVPVKELLDQTGDGKSFQHVSYQVRKPSGKPKGSLNFSYKFGEQQITAPVKSEPVTAYPAPAAGSTSAPYAASYPPSTVPPQQQQQQQQYAGGYGYPPPQQQSYGYPQPQAAYGYPPQAGYGYPPQTGYGYAPPPAPVQRSRNNKFGMGLGAGLLGGALGGLLIGDMISDADACDAGGFDF